MSLRCQMRASFCWGRTKRVSMKLLDGKVAIVTGAGSGIGRAGARLMARDGARIAVADINEDAGAAVAD